MALLCGVDSMKLNDFLRRLDRQKSSSFFMFDDFDKEFFGFSRRRKNKK